MRKTAVLQDDCEALLIPTAVPISLPAGTQVVIQQALGGSFTIEVNGNLARIEGKDAEKLGLTAAAADTKVAYTNAAEATGPCDEHAVWEQLKTCYDPEIPVNIVDLGLVYACDITPADNSLGSKVNIAMTLTAPGCGMGPVLAADVGQKVSQVANVVDVNVELVFDPPWTQDKMSQEARLRFDLL